MITDCQFSLTLLVLFPIWLYLRCLSRWQGFVQSRKACPFLQGFAEMISPEFHTDSAFLVAPCAASYGLVFTPIQIATLSRAACESEALALDCLHAWYDQGWSWSDIYLEGVTHAARTLGDWWLQDRLSFVEVTIGLSHLQNALGSLSPKFLASAGQAEAHDRVLLLVYRPSQHSLGMFMVAEFFRRAGWRVDEIQTINAHNLQKHLEAHWYDLMGFSVSQVEQVSSTQLLIRALRGRGLNAELQTMVGGSLALTDFEAVQKIGASFVALDAQSAVNMANAVVQSSYKAQCQLQLTPTG